MADPFAFCDEWGPEKVIHLYEPGTGMRAVLVVDNVAAGPAIGGVRVALDGSVDEAFRLARAMTLKNAAAGLPHGGGKAILFADPGLPLPQKEQLVRAFACAIRDQRDYIPGPDMGLDERAMAWIRDEIGRSVGLPAALGGIPLDEIGATGFGVAVCGEVAQDYSEVRLAGARIAVQGFGSVGQHAARFLCERGAILVAVADSRGAIASAKGLPLSELRRLKAHGGSVVDLADAEPIAPDELVEVECDIWIPAARPDVIREDNAELVRARLVLEGANIPVTERAEEILHERGVLVVPDFIANAGGVICAAVEYRGGTERVAFQEIEEKIRRNTREVLEEARRTGVTPRCAALELAGTRVGGAVSYRRWADA